MTYVSEALAFALILAGLGGIFFTDAFARAYGVALTDEASRGFTRAAAIRDLVIGIALGAAAFYGDRLLMGILLAAGIVLSIADFVIVYRHHHGRLHRSHAIHAAGAVAFVLALAMAMFAVGR